MSDIIYHNFLAEQAVGNIDFDTDVLKVALLGSGYTPDADHTKWTNVSGNEIANGYGYTAGGITVSGSVVDDDSDDQVKYSIANPSWTASGGSIGPARYGVLYDDTHTDDALMYLFDFGGIFSAYDGNPFVIQIDANGLFVGKQA